MRIVTTILFLSFILSAYGQSIIFEHINAEQGLTQNDVNDIYQDQEGFIWFATNEGVNRYDGIEFKSFLMSNADSNSVSSNLIMAFDEDSEGNLWIATQDMGICKFNREKETFQNFSNNKQQSDLLSSNIVHDIYCDSSKQIFIATYYGIDYLKPDNTGKYQVYHTTGLADSITGGTRQKYFKFHHSPNGNFLILMGQGVAQIHVTTDSSWLEPFLEELPLYDVHALINIDNEYIIGHEEGVSYVIVEDSIKHKYSVQTYPCGKVMSVVRSKDGTLWVGSNTGIYQFKFDTDNNSVFSLLNHSTEGDNIPHISSNNINTVFADKSGIVWIGTNGGGINKYNPLNRQFRNYSASNKPSSLSNNKVQSIFEDKQHNIWIGTEGGGANFLSSRKEHDYNNGFKQYYHNVPGEQHFVFDFCAIKSSKPEIWIGTGYHARMACLKQITNNYWEVIPSYLPISRGMVLSIFQDEFNTIWLGTYNGGLFRAIATDEGYQVNQFDMLNSNVCANTIRNFHEDSKGRLWIGTSDGLMVLNRNEKTKTTPFFTIFQNDPKNDSSLSHNHILPIVETSSSEIWLGTMGGGINKYIEGTAWNNGHFKHLTSNDGLVNNTIKEIIIDDNGIFWIGSNRGLTKFNPINYKIRNYDIKDGLQSYEFVELAGCKLHDGEILMGGIHGFNAFYPNEIKEDSTPPNIIFNRLEIMDHAVEINEKINGNLILTQSINSTNTIILRHTENNFTIHFAALHFSNPEFNQYKYQLVGYDTEWIKTSAALRFAKYTNLDAGKYVFQVLASNSDGYWTLQPKTITIIIKPPYWETLWFRTCIIIFIIMVLLIFYFWKIQDIRAQKETLQRVVYERTNDLLEINTQLEENKEEILAQKEEIQNKRDQLQFHKENLEKLIKNRTSELVLAKEQAEESDKLKSAFLANMSHEIRTPMNAVIGFSTLLEEDVVDASERNTYLKQIKQNSEKLLILIDDILAISLIEANQLKINQQNIRLSDLLEDSFMTAQVSCKNEHVSIEIDNKLHTKDIHLFTDSFRLNQILTNLLSNAIKFTTKGKITIIAKEVDKGDFQISVKDTGKGIQEEDLESIFERFRKIDDDPTIIYPGVGLGLSISYKLAEMLDCKLWVESEVGKGSEFFLRIPASFESNRYAASHISQPDSLNEPEFNDKNILVVEDVIANYQLLERMLVKVGCEVSLAKNGLVALNLFKEGKTFDVVLMDIKMPVMNGIDSFNEIKKLAPDQCFIAQTAFALDSDKKQFMDIGFNGYVSKPIRQKELLNVLQKCFHQKDS